MSQTFADRFKGRIEEFKKDGIHKIISSTSNPVNHQKTNYDNPIGDHVLRSKENKNFSRNAQNNILDFQKKFQTIIHPSQNQVDSSHQEFNHQKMQRQTYSASDPINPIHSVKLRNVYQDQFMHYNYANYPSHQENLNTNFGSNPREPENVR